MKHLVLALFVFYFLVRPFEATAQPMPCFPQKDNRHLVYDESQLLKGEEKQLLDNKLIEFARRTSNQIAVVIVSDLCGMDKAEYATRLGETWGIGTATEDNGIVLLVKPKMPDSSGETFIAVGRGLEGAIPDATAYLIVTHELIPKFRENDYYTGINHATEVLMQLAQGEYSSDEYAKQHQQSDSPPIIAIVFILFIVILLVLVRIHHVRRYARLNHLDWWTAFWLLNAAGRRHGGYFDDFTRGGRGFGGGGGFGGFGGGSFGGGGAGGSW